MTDELKPDLGLAWLEAGLQDKTIVFGRITFWGLMRHGVDSFGFTTQFTHDKVYALSCDFDRQRLEELLGLLPDPIMARWIADQFARKFDDPVMVELPRIDVGLEARLGEAQNNGQETWVPLIASSFLAPTELVTLTFLDREEDGE